VYGCVKIFTLCVYAHLIILYVYSRSCMAFSLFILAVAGGGRVHICLRHNKNFISPKCAKEEEKLEAL